MIVNKFLFRVREFLQNRSYYLPICSSTLGIKRGNPQQTEEQHKYSNLTDLKTGLIPFSLEHMENQKGISQVSILNLTIR